MERLHEDDAVEAVEEVDGRRRSKTSWRSTLMEPARPRMKMKPRVPRGAAR